jgi:hypothetical protein
MPQGGLVAASLALFVRKAMRSEPQGLVEGSMMVTLPDDRHFPAGGYLYALRRNVVGNVGQTEMASRGLGASADFANAVVTQPDGGIDAPMAITPIDRDIGVGVLQTGDYVAAVFGLSVGDDLHLELRQYQQFSNSC